MRLAILLCAAFLLIGSYSYATPEKHNPQSPNPPPITQQYKQDDRGTDKSPFVIKAVPQDKPQTEIDKDKQRELNADAIERRKADVDERIAKLTGRLAFFTLLLFIATLILAVFTGLMVRVGFLQIKDMKESISATRIAAEAAKKQADAAVGIELPIFVLEGGPTFQKNHQKFLVWFTNRGRTWSIIKNYNITLHVGNNLDPHLGYLAENTISVSDFYEQNKTIIFSIDNGIRNDDWDSALAGQTKIWVFGRFEYEDFLHARHEEGFCFSSRPSEPQKFTRLYTHASNQPQVTQTVDWVSERDPPYVYSRYVKGAEN